MCTLFSSVTFIYEFIFEQDVSCGLTVFCGEVVDMFYWGKNKNIIMTISDSIVLIAMEIMSN